MQWFGSETSDIVYEDSAGELTHLLIEKGHLSGEQWAEATPKYYIEIKSTLDRCNTPFYVSHGQADRVGLTHQGNISLTTCLLFSFFFQMMRSTNGPSGTDNLHEVYVIFRVFNLGMETTGLSIYVDPHEMRRMGKLNFMTHATFTVTPGLGA